MAAQSTGSAHSRQQSSLSLESSQMLLKRQTDGTSLRWIYRRANCMKGDHGSWFALQLPGVIPGLLPAFVTRRPRFRVSDVTAMSHFDTRRHRGGSCIVPDREAHGHGRRSNAYSTDTSIWNEYRFAA